MARQVRACSVEGCDQRSRVRGWCRTHYSRWRRKGDPLAGGEVIRQPPRPGRARPPCGVDGCTSPVQSLGLCNKHYQRLLKHGSTSTTRFRDPEEAFATLPTWNGECLEWPRLSDSGYGRMNVHGKKVRAHRYAWARTYGPIPPGLVVDHICHNKSCVNVNHLRLVTQAENMQNRKGATSSNSTGVRGVTFDPDRGKYRVEVCLNGVRHYLGQFGNIESASRAAEDKRRELGLLGSS